MPRGTTLRNVRVPEPLWAAARDAAWMRGDNLSAVIRAALEQYVSGDFTPPPPE